METYCTRPDCSQPINHFPDLDHRSKLQTAQQKYCQCCGMPQILAGRYIPQKLLGKGGFGAAYLACDRYTPKLRQCVVKQFQPSDTFNEKTLKIAEDLFTREAEVLETLGNEHPQIPDLYAFFPLVLPEEGEEGEEKQFFYIVQEFIDGETLEQEVHRKGKLNESEILEILENMLKVLQFVHEHESIHRDIKPSNIMRDRTGKLYLLDFGAVKRVTGASTTHSTGIYSMGFAPPEQMQGRQVYPSTDLYALAATCVRLMTGKPIQDLYDSYHNEWRWRNQTSAVSDKLAKILDRMLLLTPKDRFLSAQAILNVLDEKTVLGEPERSEVDVEDFSQPADWRSLLSLPQDNSEEAPTDIENEGDKSWRDLLSSSTSPNQSQDTEIEAPEDDFLDEDTSVQHPSAESLPESPPSTPEINHPVPNPEPSPPPIDLPPQYNPKPTPRTRRFALWEVLAIAGFTGLEGALLLIALTSLFNAPAISIGLWGMSMGGLLYAQWKRLIEKIDFLILGGITLAVVALFFRGEMTLIMAVILAATGGAGAVASTALFNLIYQLLSRLK